MKLTPEIIHKFKQIISEYTKVDPQNFGSRSRKREYVLSRQLLHYFVLDQFPDSTLKYVGSLTNTKTHATVLHSRKTIHNYIYTDYDVMNNCKGFKKIFRELEININAETAKTVIPEIVSYHEKKAMSARLAMLKAQGIERSYSISEFGTIFLSVKKINEREKEFITINLINNYISIVSKETLFRLMPYFYDFFTEIAEEHGKLDNEILIAILENLGIEPVNVNQPELVSL